MSGNLELLIDRTACTGHGVCAELLPEVLDLDEWGYPLVPTGPVPARLEQHARRAVTACPALALRLAKVPVSRG
jgi:ferredoxin